MSQRGPCAVYWCFTLNNPDRIGCGDMKEFFEAMVETGHFDYFVCGDEKGESGTRHYQGFFKLKRKQRLTFLKKIPEIGTAHFEAMKGKPQEASDYCKKDGDWLEYGDCPEHQGHAGGKKRKEEFAEAYALAKQQKVSHVDPEFQIKYFNSLNKIADRELPICQELDDVCGVWIYGPPGTGKTRFAKAYCTGSYYLKGPNKWWDHYKGEDVALMDDVDPNNARCLTMYFKQWMDRYPFKAEYKGGARDLRPSLFIVTSNYAPEECFNKVDAEAIRRRCDVICFDINGEHKIED